MDSKVIDMFEIPEELALELSELLTKQSVREKLLMEVIKNDEQYEIMEKKLLPIAARINAIKDKIVVEYVPEKYKSEKYIWNYSGYEIAKNKVEILEAE